MQEKARTGSEQSSRDASPVVQPPMPGAPARHAGPSPAQALALQRAAGNRAAARTLARWAVHPDKQKKGMFVPDVVAADYLKFNPPKNQ